MAAYRTRRSGEACDVEGWGAGRQSPIGVDNPVRREPTTTFTPGNNSGDGDCLGFVISPTKVNLQATYSIESTEKSKPMEIWISSFGNHSDRKKPQWKFGWDWIRGVQLAGPNIDDKDSDAGSSKENRRKREAVKAIWRDLNADDRQINPLMYFQSADIIVVALDVKAENWTQQCKLWFKEAIDSNVGHLRGVVFLLANTPSTYELKTLLRKLEKTRYQLQFQGTVHVQKVRNQNDGSAYLFDESSFVRAVRTGVLYILECQGQLPERQEEFFTEWKVFNLWENYLPQLCTNSDNSEKSFNVVLRASQFFRYDKHLKERQVDKISTSVWDITHLERLTFQCRLLIESFFLTIAPTYLLTCAPLCAKMARRKYREYARRKVSSDEVGVTQTSSRDDSNYNSCWMCVFATKRMYHTRSFWGSGKWLFARSPLMALVKETSSGYPVGYHWAMEWKQIISAVLLFLSHCLFCTLFISTIYMAFLSRIEHDETRDEFKTTANHYFVHYIGFCIVYSFWTFVLVVPYQIAGVREVQLLGTPRGNDRITNLIDRLKDLAHTHSDTQEKSKKDDGMVNLMNELELDNTRTTENLEIIIKRNAYETISTRWKSLSVMAAMVASGIRIAVSYASTVIHKGDFQDVSTFDQGQFHFLRAGSGLLLGVGIYMILYTAGATAKLCLKTMTLVTDLLVLDEQEPQGSNCCDNMRFCGRANKGCIPNRECRQPEGKKKDHQIESNQEQESLPQFLVPFLPLNAHGWLHIRQNLFNQTHASFVESSGILLVPVLLIAFAAGHIIVILFKKRDIFLRVGVLVDAVLVSFALLYVAFEASKLEDVQNRQLRLLSNHLTSVQQLQDQLDRDPNTQGKYVEEIRPILSQSYTSFEIVRTTVRDNYLSMTLWPGITLSKDLAASMLFALGTLASTVINYWIEQ